VHITLAAIGRPKASPEIALLEEYQKRLTGFGWQLTLKQQTVKKNLTGDALKKAEADVLLSLIDEKAPLVALDERGQNLTSQKFATKLEALQTRHLNIVIGGADGLHADVLQKATFKLALGQLTWPHKLVMPMIGEQIYRACTLLNNHPYHRE